MHDSRAQREPFPRAFEAEMVFMFPKGRPLPHAFITISASIGTVFCTVWIQSAVRLSLRCPIGFSLRSTPCIWKTALCQIDPDSNKLHTDLLWTRGEGFMVAQR
jgi:hypothetical protein